jgi:hypothetical protein
VLLENLSLEEKKLLKAEQMVSAAKLQNEQRASRTSENPKSPKGS